MMLTGEMLETLTAPAVGQRLAHDLVEPLMNRVSLFSKMLGRSVPQGSWRFRSEIHVASLDYSVESLAVVDRHLEKLHGSLPDGPDGKDLNVLGSEQLRSVIPTVGCYVGEVLRRNGADDHVWTYHFDYLQQRPDRAVLIGEEPSPSTILMLTTSSGSFITPLGKVFKFLADGPGDATQALAEMIRQGVDNG